MVERRRRGRSPVWLCAAVLVAATPLSACERAGSGPPPPPPPSIDAGPRADAGPVGPGSCARPAEGCPCDGDEPVSCYPAAQDAEDGTRTCYRGTRYCRDGEWSGCESIQTWVQGEQQPGRSSAPLIGEAEQCDSCDPTCSRTQDEPDGADVDPDDGLEYCDPPGGLCLVPVEPPPPPPPEGCDIWYEVSFGETADHVFTVTLPAGAEEVSVYPVDDDTTAMDERHWVDAVVATSCASCAPGASGRNCEGCPEGATVELTVTFENDLVLSTTSEQIIEFDMVAVADASTAPDEIDRQHACVRVPPVDATSCVAQGFACSTNEQCCTGVCASVPGRSFSECASASAICRGTGGACTVAADCCVGGCVDGFCDDTATCYEVGAARAGNSDCCNGNCDAGTCAARSCLPQNDRCSNDGQCCSGNCKSNGRCGSGSVCAVVAERCSNDNQCCSSLCEGGACQPLDFCRAAGEPCSQDGDCCGLSCAGGYCEIISTECLPRYEPCHQNSECCGLRCDPDDNGVSRCLPLGGCRTSGPTPGDPFGEVCSGDAQCCSGQCAPDPDGDLRCKRLNTGNTGCNILAEELAPNGEQCNNDCQCVSGNCEMLAVSTVHSRCMLGGPCVVEGQTCSVPEDCCGGVCAFWPDEVYRCGLPPDTVYTMGEFQRTWDGDATCAPNENPDWGELTWSATIEPNTYIRFEFQTASTLEGLDAATVVSFTDPSSTPPVDIGGLLVANGVPNYLQYLRLTAVLVSEDGSYTPVLHEFQLSWTCTPTE